MEPQPQPPSLQEHPPPQFVAAKSLMFETSKFFVYTVSYVLRKYVLQKF